MGDDVIRRATPGQADLQRWRLILGPAAESRTGGLGEENAGRDAALDWLYGRDDDLGKRGVRRGGARGAGDRGAGDEPSMLTTVDWLEGIHRLFPKETIERLERDAIERYEIHDVLTNPEVLERIEPNPSLLKAVLRTKHLMNPQVLAAARRIVEEVVRQTGREALGPGPHRLHRQPHPQAEPPPQGPRLRPQAHAPRQPQALPARGAARRHREAALPLAHLQSAWSSGRSCFWSTSPGP